MVLPEVDDRLRLTVLDGSHSFRLESAHRRLSTNWLVTASSQPLSHLPARVTVHFGNEYSHSCEISPANTFRVGRREWADPRAETLQHSATHRKQNATDRDGGR